MMIEIPPNIKKRDTDGVSYIAMKPGDKEKKQTNYACYAMHTASLSECDFWLFRDTNKDPCGNYLACPPDIYLKWVDLLKDRRVVPLNVEAGVNESNELTMFVPRGHSRHTVYATLCAYRWAESYAPMVYTVVKLWETLPDISFWQILHYAKALYITSNQTGHGWANISRPESVSYATHNYGGAFNLAHSLCWPLFWAKTEKEKDACAAKAIAYTFYTTYALNQLASEIGGLVSEKGVQWPCLLVNAIVDSKPEKSDILNPRWTTLYKLVESLTHEKTGVVKELLKKEYDRITQGDDALASLQKEIIKQVRGRWY